MGGGNLMLDGLVVVVVVAVVVVETYLVSQGPASWP